MGYFHFFEAFYVAFEVQGFFQPKASFLHLIKDTDSMYIRDTQLVFLKWKHC